eukprot:5929213-Pyramimonas_sp.AAC.1
MGRSAGGWLNARNLTVLALVVVLVTGSMWLQLIQIQHMRTLEHSVVRTQKAVEKLTSVGEPRVRERVKYITVPSEPAENASPVVREAEGGVRETLAASSVPQGLLPFVPIQPALLHAFERYKRLHADMLVGTKPAQ